FSGNSWLVSISRGLREGVVLLDDGLRVRAHAAPDVERFGSLLDEHAEPLLRARSARVARPDLKRREAASVREVVAARSLSDDRARERRRFALEPRGRRIDHEVERGLALEPVERADREVPEVA